MSGVAKITQQEIQAWQANHDIKLNHFELGLIEMFDNIAIEISNTKGAQ